MTNNQDGLLTCVEALKSRSSKLRMSKLFFFRRSVLNSADLKDKMYLRDRAVVDNWRVHPLESTACEVLDIQTDGGQ